MVKMVVEIHNQCRGKKSGGLQVQRVVKKEGRNASVMDVERKEVRDR